MTKEEFDRLWGSGQRDKLWNRDMAIAALVAIANSDDADEGTKEGARQEILVLVGAKRGRYTVEERARNHALLREAIDNPPAAPEPQPCISYGETDFAKARRIARESSERARRNRKRS
jgi:hypothetical protein